MKRNERTVKRRAGAYFDRCAEKGEPLTVSGLALVLGMTRDELYAAAGANHDAALALTEVEKAYELRLIGGKGGDGYALKLLTRESGGGGAELSLEGELAEYGE